MRDALFLSTAITDVPNAQGGTPWMKRVVSVGFFQGLLERETTLSIASYGAVCLPCEDKLCCVILQLLQVTWE